MVSEEWKKAVELMKKEREQTIAERDKENAVISAGKLIASIVKENYWADVLIPRNDSEEEIKINEMPYQIYGVDSDLLLKLLEEAGYDAEFRECGIEGKAAIKVLLR